nr:NFACT family protein [Alicyclobacillus acidocaldarius]
MDGWTLRRLARELDDALRGARIDRVYQPGERDLVLAVRSAHLGARRLYVSAHQQFARVHFLADERPDNPATPPMFCVLLRKHIEGGASSASHSRDGIGCLKWQLKHWTTSATGARTR